MKFILYLYPEKIVLPLLTILLWLVATYSSSAAQQQVVPMTTGRIQQPTPASPHASRTPLPSTRGTRARGWLLNGGTPRTALAPLPISPSPQLLYSGTQVSLNGRTFHVEWSQRQLAGLDKVHTGISDAGLLQLLGVELLNTKNAAKQPAQWFSQTTNTPLVLTSWLTPAYRYVDLTELARTAGWKLSVVGNTLLITTPVARVGAIYYQDQQTGKDTCRQGLRQVSVGKSPWEMLLFKDLLGKRERLIVDLDRPTPWQITQVKRGRGRDAGQGGYGEEWLITIDAAITPALIQSFNSSPIVPAVSPSPPLPLSPSSPQHPSIKIETEQFRTIIRMEVPFGLHPHVATLPNPNRLVIDFRPDTMVERDLLWAPGLRWRQQFLNIGASRFPVVWLEINLRAFGLKLKPIWRDPTTLVGIAPLLQTAQRYAAAAAINGGFLIAMNIYPWAQFAGMVGGFRVQFLTGARSPGMMLGK